MLCIHFYRKIISFPGYTGTLHRRQAQFDMIQNYNRRITPYASLSFSNTQDRSANARIDKISIY